MELDERLVQLRIDIIERNLKEIREISKLKEMSYRDELALKHALLECIEACVDIANHIIATKGFRRPVDYKDVFRVLVENGIIDEEFSQRLQGMVGFRKVHRYAYVDPKKLLEFASEDIKDIERFVRVVLRLIKTS